MDYRLIIILGKKGSCVKFSERVLNEATSYML